MLTSARHVHHADTAEHRACPQTLLVHVCHRMSKGVREAPGKALIGELAAESGDKTEGAFGELHH